MQIGVHHMLYFNDKGIISYQCAMICCITSRTHGMYTYAFCAKIASLQVFIIVTRIETALTHSFQYHSDQPQLYLMVLDGGGVLNTGSMMDNNLPVHLPWSTLHPQINNMK